MYPLPFTTMSRKESSSALKPSFIMPPSRTENGGSSQTELSMRDKTSSSKSMLPFISLSSALLKSEREAFICGREFIAAESARSSLAFAVSYMILAIRRSISFMPLKESVRESSAMGLSASSPTALWRLTILGR